MSVINSLQDAARRIRHDVMTVYFAARDSRTPWVVRLLALGVAAYALSPIDLIPDVIPVLGYLDDMILLPLGIILVIRFTPPDVVEASRAKALALATNPVSNVAAAVIVVLWVLCAVGFGYWVMGVSST